MDITLLRDPIATFFSATELVFHTLLFLDVTDFSVSVRSVSKNFYKFLRDDYFWRCKVIRDFSEEVASYRPEDTTCHQQYMYLLGVHDPDVEASVGRLDGVIVCGMSDVPSAVFSEIFFSENKISNEVNSDNKVDEENDSDDESQTSYHVGLARRLSTLLPTQQTANTAMFGGYSKILKWLWTTYDILPSDDSIKQAARNGITSSLEFLIDYKLFDREEIVWLIKHLVIHDNLEMIKWFASKNIHPTWHQMVWATISNRVDIGVWLYTTYGFESTNKCFHRKILKRIEMNKVNII